MKLHMSLLAVLLLVSCTASNNYPSAELNERELARKQKKTIRDQRDTRESLKTLGIKGKVKRLVTSYYNFNPFGCYEQPGDAHPTNDTMLFNKRGYLTEKIKHGRSLCEYNKEVRQYDENDNDTTSYSTFYQRAEPIAMGETQKAGYHTYKTINDPLDEDTILYDEKTRIYKYRFGFRFKDTGYNMFYSFDKNGNVIANWAFDEYNKPTYIACSLTDANGNEIAEIISPAEGIFRISFIKTYDDRGNILKEIRYKEDGKLSSTTYNEYDEQDNVIVSYVVDDSNKYVRRDYYSYTYDAMGNTTRIISSEGDGFRMVVVSIVEYSYEYY